MARVCVPAGLAVAILVLCGCSSAVQRVDLREWHKYLAKDPYTGTDAPRPGKASSPSGAQRAAVARDLIERAEREEAAVLRSEFRPWIRVDMKQREQLGADEAQEQGPKASSICRSC